jgi:hypothetical protein
MRFLIASLLSVVSVATATFSRRQSSNSTSKNVDVNNDPLYTKPYVDVDEWRDKPLRHRYVHGGYNGTDLRFSFYFPPKEVYQGRFLQGLPAVAGNEKVVFQPLSLGAIIGDIAPFAFESGAYVVESNQGRTDMYTGPDATITGFRGSAAAARHGRKLALEMYGGSRPYGYVFGGSGGGFKTIACIENGTDTWQGAVPFIIGSPVSIPNVFSIQGHAMRILSKKFPMIVDNIDPGGSGNMFDGLNLEERDALAEVTRMGFPPPAWFRYKKIALGYTGVLTGLLDKVIDWDPTYFSDFWTKPGYLGSSPTESLKSARLQHKTTIKRVILSSEAQKMGLPISMSGKMAGGLMESPAAVILDNLPGGEMQGVTITLGSGTAKGTRLFVSGVIKDIVLIGYGEQNFKTVGGMKVGDEAKLDNDIYLAAQTYHRHQSPGPEYPVFEQFKVAGKPIYPIRPSLLDIPDADLTGTGNRQTGKFSGKVIVVEAHMDEAAYAWQADWYRTQVKKQLGDKTDSQFRLWMVDKAMHTSPQQSPGEPGPAENTRIVTYVPVIQQALRDVINWVEKGTPPPVSTEYRIEDGQVVMPSTAKDRKGIQPVVTLTANGRERADVPVGQAVEFFGTIEVPPGTGKAVEAQFDFEGQGTYPVSSPLIATGEYSAQVKTSYTFSKPGTYFPALRGYSQREGVPKSSNGTSPFGRAHNLGRVRVVVT